MFGSEPVAFRWSDAQRPARPFRSNTGLCTRIQCEEIWQHFENAATASTNDCGPGLAPDVHANGDCRSVEDLVAAEALRIVDDQNLFNRDGTVRDRFGIEFGYLVCLEFAEDTEDCSSGVIENEVGEDNTVPELEQAIELVLSIIPSAIKAGNRFECEQAFLHGATRNSTLYQPTVGSATNSIGSLIWQDVMQAPGARLTPQLGNIRGTILDAFLGPRSFEMKFSTTARPLGLSYQMRL